MDWHTGRTPHHRHPINNPTCREPRRDDGRDDGPDDRPASRPRAGRARRAGLIALLAPLLAALTVSIATGQAADTNTGTNADTNTDTSDTESAAPLQLDLEALLRSSRVLDETSSGPVWAIEAPGGKRLIHVPFVITTPKQEVELSGAPVDLRGGRFLAWRMPGQGGDDQRGEFRPRRGGTSRSMSTSSDPGQPQAGVAPGAPRYTRDLTLLPSKRVRWELERAVPSGNVQSGESDYRLKLRPERFQELEPERPDVQRRSNEDRREFSRRRREAINAFRDKHRAFVDRRRRVLDLPDTFEIQQPDRLWAVYELITHFDALRFTGEAPSLPWSIQLSDLKMLRQFAGADDNRRRPRDQQAGADQRAVQRMRELAGDGHPLTMRLIAYALHENGILKDVRLGGPVYSLAQVIIHGPDDEARHRVLSDLASTSPPTSAVLSLLQNAAGRMDPQIQLLLLRSLLDSALENIEQQQELYRVANELLADPSGPPPDEVMSTMAQHLDPSSSVFVGATNRIEFQSLPQHRLDNAIAYAITAAGERPLASSWLNHRMLGSSDPRLVQRTLELLQRADRGTSEVAPLVNGLFDLAFEPRFEAGGEQAPVRLKLTRRIPIDSSNHSLYRALNSGDEQVYEPAWQSLPLFRIPNADGQMEASRYTLLLEAALSLNETPPQIVTFLQDQPDQMLATVGLVRVVIEADDTAVSQAARVLRGSERPIGDVLQQLDRAQRVRFGEKIYNALADGPPPVVALLGERGDEPRVATWFGERLANGRLPAIHQWASAYNERRLLERAGDLDKELARAAVIALVTANGGTISMAQELANRFTGMTDRTETKLREAWEQAKQEIYARRVGRTTGPYRVLVQAPPEQPGYAPPAPIVIGVLDLVEQEGAFYLGRGQTVSLSIPKNRLAVVIENPNELTNFDNDALRELQLETIKDGIELTLNPNGEWTGSARMQSRRGDLTVRLEPVQ